MNVKASIRIFCGLVIVFAVALLLRTYNLNEVPVFADEAIYVRWAQIMKAEPTLRFIPLSDGKQPLFMWSVIPSFKVFSDPLIAGRMVSVVTGIGTLVGVFIFAYLLIIQDKIVSLKDLVFQKNADNALKVGFAAALFYAISPYAVFFDRMALADSMLSMFGIWFVILFFVTIKTMRLDAAMLAGFALGGAALTKSPALFMALMAPSLWLLSNWPKKGKKVHSLKLIALTAVSWVFGIGMYNIQRLGPNFHLLSSRTADYVYPVGRILTSPFDPLFPYLDRSLDYFLILGPAILVVMALISLILLFKEWSRVGIVLSVWLFGPIVIVSEYSKTMTARYIYYSFPYFIILAALLFASSYVTNMVKNKKYAVLRNFLMIALLIGVVGTIGKSYALITNIEAANLPRSERSGYLEEWTAGTGIREASEIIRNEYTANPEQKIVVGTEGYFGTLPDGMQMYLNDLPEITVIGVGLNIGEVPVQLTESFNAGNRTLLVVNSSRLKINETDFENKGLSVVMTWEKADRPNDIREYVQHGERDTFYLLELKEILD